MYSSELVDLGYQSSSQYSYASRKEEYISELSLNDEHHEDIEREMEHEKKCVK